MSDLRIALIAEGPTDAIIIQAALKALLPRSFTLVALQPDEGSPELGSGWGGVLRWCMKFSERGHPNLEEDPTLPGFDLFIIHLDADVAGFTYADVSSQIATEASEKNWPLLPNSTACPPPTADADVMRNCILSWTGMTLPGSKTVLCIPSKAIDAWLAASVLGQGHKLLIHLECNGNLGSQLAALPKTQRIKKTKFQYQNHEHIVTKAWSRVRQQCTQADHFSRAIETLLL